MIRVGLVGLGGMGRTHFECYGRNPDAEVVAICDVDPQKLEGKWTALQLNIGDIATQAASGEIRRYTDFHEMVRDPDIDLIDVCAPTPMHAPVSIEALNNGKHVICEKPMAFDTGQCWAMEQAVKHSGKQLMIAHCLRYWPQYVKAHEILRSGQYGRVLYASFHRSGATPNWSTREWMRKPEMSGGAVLDMHIHDVDTALWWFGKPSSVHTTGLCIHGLPTAVDSYWRYNDGPVVLLHGSWDHNGGPFRYAFKLVFEHASLVCDSNIDGAVLKLFRDGETTVIDPPQESAYQAEIDDLIACLNEGRPVSRVTPDDGRMAVEIAREELRQMGAHV